MNGTATQMASADNVQWTDGLNEPVHEALRLSASKHPDRPAIDFLGRVMTWNDLNEQAGVMARGLKAIGLEKGDRVGLLLPNTPYYVTSYFAVSMAGGIVVNMNPLYAAKEIEFLLKNSGVKMVITVDLNLTLPKIVSCIDETQIERVVVCSMSQAMPTALGLLFQLFKRGERAWAPDDERFITFERVLDIGGDAASVNVEIDPKKDLAVLQYTGGTTGSPKGAMLTHSNVATNAAQVSNWYCPSGECEDRMLGVLPLFHIFAMTAVMNLSVRLSATMILMPRFKLSQLISTITQKKPTILVAVPTLLNAIVHHPKIEHQDLSSLEYCISGGASLPPEVKQRFEELTGCQVVEGYGLSEASPVVTCNSGTEQDKPGSIGLPMPGLKVTIRDPEENNNKMGLNELGEICVEGPTVMRGYWRNEEATRDCLIDGVLRTGDIGRFDEDGYFFLVDRIKDVVITNGYKVYPRNIEEAIYRHDSVAEVTVIGIDHEQKGQVPKAFVRLKEGESLSEGDLLLFLKDHLSLIEMPDTVEFRGELPKTLIGKLSKKELAAEEKDKNELQ